MTTEEIAERLTEAQQRMIVDIGDGQPREYALGQTGFALMRMGLVFINDLGARHLTDRGHQARRILQSKGKEQ